MDGTIVPIPPETAWSTGAYHHMPILGGTTKDELTSGLAITEYFSGPPQVALTPAQYLASNSPDVLAQLGQQASTNTGYGVYGYDFTYQHAPFYFPQMPNTYDATGHFQALAYHTSDIQFVFPKWHGGNLGANLDQVSGQPREIQGAEINLSDQLVAAWTNFARTGNPNGSGNSPWPQFTSSSPKLLQQDIPNGIETAAQFKANYKCDFWAAQ